MWNKLKFFCGQNFFRVQLVSVLKFIHLFKLDFGDNYNDKKYFSP